MRHIPAEGRASGFEGPAMCGRWGKYMTADHKQIRRLALHALNEGRLKTWCDQCMSALLVSVKKEG